jgi:hypothetical protein
MTVQETTFPFQLPNRHSPTSVLPLSITKAQQWILDFRRETSENKVTLYNKTYYLPIFTHESETWIGTKRDISRLQEVEPNYYTFL